MKSGRNLTAFESQKYGKSKSLRYVKGTDEPVYPISYTQHCIPMSRKRTINCYTPEGRKGLHDNLKINTRLMLALMRCPVGNKSVELADNRISLFWGGSSPSTSFDCSGFVCWVLNKSGAMSIERTTATGIYNRCTVINKADAKPGDLIFFTGTYNSPGPISHIGIYVGME